MPHQHLLAHATETESIPLFWLALGFVGQIIFAGRFVLQWLASEREKKSVVPLSFWILSIAGASMLLTYAIYRRDPVFIAGQCMGFFIYFRNLHFVLKHRAEQAEQAAESAEAATETEPLPQAQA